MHSVGCFYAIYIEKLLISKLHLIRWRNFPEVALLALPVGVAHGEPAFPSCLAAALAPSWHEQKSSSHHMVLQSIRKAAEGPLQPQFGAAGAPKAICFARGWVWNLGDLGSRRNRCCFSVRAEARCCRSGVAVPLWGWIFANFGGFGMTLLEWKNFAQMPALPWVIAWVFPCQLIWLWRFAWFCFPWVSICMREILLISLHQMQSPLSTDPVHVSPHFNCFNNSDKSKNFAWATELSFRF